MGLLSEITPLAKSASSLRELARLKEEKDAADALRLGLAQKSTVNLDGAAAFTVDGKQMTSDLEKRYSFKISPVLRSVTVETGDDAEVTVQRLVGAELNVTFKF